MLFFQVAIKGRLRLILIGLVNILVLKLSESWSFISPICWSVFFLIYFLFNIVFCRLNLRYISAFKIFLQPADVEVGRLVEEAEKLKQLNHHDAPAIVRQVSAMEARWQRFLSRMEDHRAMLEASIEFHQLYEQVCY